MLEEPPSPPPTPLIHPQRQPLNYALLDEHMCLSHRDDVKDGVSRASDRNINLLQWLVQVPRELRLTGYFQRWAGSSLRAGQAKFALG
jgi:hypothetical protein